MALSFTRLIAVLLFTSGISCQNVFAADYYVDASASAGGDGLSAETAWNTLAQVNASMGMFAAGDHIRLKRGTTFYNESLLISNVQGTAVNPIVFEAYGDIGDPLPVIDGTKAVTWTAENNNIYSAVSSKPGVVVYKGTPKPPTTTLRLDTVPVTLTANAILMRVGVYANFWVRSTNGTNVSGITWNDFSPGQQVTHRYVENGREEKSSEVLLIEEVITTGNEADAGLTEWGDWYYDNGRIYLLAEEHPDISSDVQVPNADPRLNGIRWPDGIRIILSSYVHIQDISVQKFNSNGVVPAYSSNITVQGVEVLGCGARGIYLWNASNNIIQNNTFDMNDSGISLYAFWGDPPNLKITSNNLISNNSITNSRGPGITLVRDEVSEPGDVSGNIIDGNTITNSTTMSYDNGGVYTFYAGPNTIQNNVIRDGGSTYLTSAGIEVDVRTDFMTISGNTIENNSTGGVVVSGAGHIITNNTLLNNGAALEGRSQIGFFYAGTPASDCTVTGNIIEANQGNNFIVSNTEASCSGHTINNNTYRYTGTGASELFYWPCSSFQWMDFETWQILTGHDADSTPPSEWDCSGIWGGDNLLDNCGTCDNDPSNDCVMDCNGDWGGDGQLDECGVCDGDSTVYPDGSPCDLADRSGAVTIAETGLIWQQNTADTNEDLVRDVNDKLIFTDAMNYCDGLVFAGYTDWRLPTKDEMKGLVLCVDSSGTTTKETPLADGAYCEGAYVRPTIDKNVFDSISRAYWSNGADRPWITSFLHGRTWITWDAPYYVRCVRDDS